MPVPEIDFSTIGNLPKIYKDAQLQANRERTLAELGQGAGPLDYNELGRKLLSADPEFGLSLLKLGQQHGFQERQLTETGRHNVATEGLTGSAQAEARRQHDIAEAKPIAVQSGASLVTREGKPVFQNTSSQFDDQTITDMAAQYRAGDKSVMQNLGRGNQGAENISRLRAEIARQSREAGETPQQMALRMADFEANKAGMRSLSVRGAGLEYAGATVTNAIKLANESIDKVPRSKFVPLNKLAQLVASNLSSPEQADLFAKTNTLVNEYANVVTPRGVPTDATRNHAREMLNTAMNPEAYKAVTRAMQQEVDAASRAFHTTREQFRTGGATGPAVSTAAPGAAPAKEPVINSKAEYDKLPPNTNFVDKNGKKFTKP